MSKAPRPGLLAAKLSEPQAAASSILVRIAPMFFIYLALGPFLAALIFLGLRSYLGDPLAHKGEVIAAFYLFGAPAALASAIVHALMRNVEAVLGFCAVAFAGSVLGAIGGPLAAGAGFLAVCVCFPAAQAMHNRI